MFIHIMLVSFYKKLKFLLGFSLKLGIVLIATISYFNTQAQTRKYSNEFLNIGVDASAFGMSNAVTSFVSGVNASYWNPAGLALIESNELALMHAGYFANIANYNYVGFAMPIDDYSGVGLSLIRFGVDGILDTTKLIDDEGNVNFDRINTFSAADYGVVFSYGRKMFGKNLSLGVNAKIIRRVIGDFASSWGFGIDVGLQYSTKNDWKLGVMARDITTTFNAWAFDGNRLEDIQNAIEGQNQEAPEKTEITIPKLEMGISKKWIIKHDYSLLASLNMNMRFIESNDLISNSALSINPALGMQFAFLDLAFLRLGSGNFQYETTQGERSLSFQPNFGVGFKYKGIAIDYALTDISDQSVALYSNVFSLKIDLNIFR